MSELSPIGGQGVDEQKRAAGVARETKGQLGGPAALRSLRSALIDVVYPRRCAGCGRRGAWLCADCDAALPRFTQPWCERCGVPTAIGRCRCDGLADGLAMVRAVGPFAGWLRSAVVAFKYHEEWARAEHLGDVLAEAIAAVTPVDALVPVPLHASRLRRRGYNQSALLAERAGTSLGIPVVEMLERVRPTVQQVGLGGEARRANVAGAFRLVAGGNPSERRLVLVDDVVTTGATAGACTEALRGAGASAILACALCREL